MHMRVFRKHLGRLVLMVAAVAVAQGNQWVHGQADRGQQPLNETEILYYDFVDDQGRLTGGRLLVPVDLSVLAAPVDGIANNRIDLVVVGDGYTASQLGLYAAHATNATNSLFAQEPFARYKPFFIVHVINVTSIDSGVDHDPTFPTWRNTAMNMGFWCNNIERLLCVNVGLAYSFAAAAPEVDQVLALANSTKYGGAGYTVSNLATASGGNASAAEIATHEFGHSIGDLADEYDYADGATYTGAEPAAPNISKLTAAQMASAGTKWAAWLNHNDLQFDGLISTYQGAGFYQFGLYRPTNNSKMRSLNRPFNLPSVENLVVSMYRTVRPIDNSTPTAQPLLGYETVFVDPVDPVNAPLSVQWMLSNQPIAGATGTTLNLASLCLNQGNHALSVRVTDNTSWVRNEALRAQWMTQTLAWQVVVSPGCAAAVIAAPHDQTDVDDLLAVIEQWSTADTCADVAPPAGDGVVNIDDLLAVINGWGPCP